MTPRGAIDSPTVRLGSISRRATKSRSMTFRGLLLVVAVSPAGPLRCGEYVHPYALPFDRRKKEYGGRDNSLRPS
jgi:hypothetical protein